MSGHPRPLEELTFPTQRKVGDIVLGQLIPDEVLNRVQNFQFHSSDVLVQGYPKSGDYYNEWESVSVKRLERTEFLLFC